MHDIEYLPLKQEVKAPTKPQDRITAFSPLPTGWYAHYIVNDLDEYKACPGVLEVKTYSVGTGRNELLSVVYIAGVFDQGELIGADELDGYQDTVFQPEGKR